METYEITEFLLPKLAAFCSLVGSGLILAEIHGDYQAKSRKSSHASVRRRLSAVPRALISMSIGDVFFSAAWFMASWVVAGSEDIRHDFHPTTSAACRIQAFFLQWGYLASLCFNASLAVISLLMVRYNWSERRMVKAFQPVAMALWLITLAIAIVPFALDMYHDAGAACWISAPPPDLSEVGVDCQDPDVYFANEECQLREDVSAIVVPFQILPIWFCIILDSVIMLRIYQKTKEMERHSKLQDTNDFFGVDPNETEKTYNLHGELDYDASGSDLSKVRSEREDPLDKLQRVDSFRNKFQQYQEERKVMSDFQNSNGSMPPLQEVEEVDVVQDTDGAADEESIHLNDDMNDLDASKTPTTTAAPTKPVPECDKKCQKRSHGVAVQGMWYIAGFLLTFGVTTISIAAFLITGEWVPALYRAGYTFFALQGFWNFLIFSRGRRKMRTWVGRQAKTLLWEHCFWLCCKCKCLFQHKQEQIMSPSTTKMKKEQPKQPRKRPSNNNGNSNGRLAGMSLSWREGTSQQTRRGSLNDVSNRHDTYYKASANTYKDEGPMPMTSASECGWDASQKSASRRGSGSGRDHSRRASHHRDNGSEASPSCSTSVRSDASPASTLRTASTVLTDPNALVPNSNNIRMARIMSEVEEADNENSRSRHSSTIDMLVGGGEPKQNCDISV